MKRLLAMLIAILLFAPLVAHAREVSDPQHFNFEVPAGWVVTTTNTAAADGDVRYVLKPQGSTGESPMIAVIYSAGSFKSDPQALINTWKAQIPDPQGGLVLRNDVAYDPLTGHVVADRETLSDLSYTQARAVFIAGQNSTVAILLRDQSNGFTTHVNALNVMVDSLQTDTDAPAAAGMGDPEAPNALGKGGIIALCVIVGLALLVVLGVGSAALIAIIVAVVRARKRTLSAGIISASVRSAGVKAAPVPQVRRPMGTVLPAMAMR